MKAVSALLFGALTALQAPEADAVRDRLDAYLLAYEPQLSSLVAEELLVDARIGVLPFDAVIWVDFKPDEKLGLLVPVEMKEEFFAGRFREGTGTARYTKYRKFQTTARIVPPSGQ